MEHDEPTLGKKLKLKTKYQVLEQAINGKDWHVLEEFKDKDDQLEYLTKTTLEEGFIDRPLKLQVVYVWE